MLIRLRALLLGAAVLLLVAAPAHAQRQTAQWVLLGTQTVGFQVDRDTIEVGRNAGRFDKIRFRVKDSDIFFISVAIIFASGERQDVQLNARLQAEAETRPIELTGGIRAVERIEMVYRARPSFRGRATVEVYGERIEFTPPQVSQDSWELLGKEVAGRGIETDVVQIGREAGRFHALKLRVLRNDLYLHDIKIVYANGETDVLEVRRQVTAGSETQPITFQGRDRSIKEIHLVHRSAQSFRGRSVVEIYGERASVKAIEPVPPPQDRHLEGLVLLGTEKVGFATERDVIRVGREAGAFEKIRLRVLDNDIFLRSITIVYGNNEQEDVEVNAAVRAGEITRSLRLKSPRVIRRIELVYNARPNFRGEARVEVYGEPTSYQAPQPPAPQPPVPPAVTGEWLLLGTQVANFSVDNDTQPVGIDKGRFTGVRLRMKDHAVEVFEIRVTFGDGETKVWPIKSSFKNDEYTGTLTFERPRRVASIGMSYRSKPGFHPPARVEVWGQR